VWLVACLPACDVGVGRYDVVLITADTLRADRLGRTGNARHPSPEIDGLARESVVFEARSSSGWTLPAVATLFTGRRPRAHGVSHLDGRLPPELPTLSEILHAHDYETRAYVSQGMLDGRHGFRRGFDRFDESMLDPRYRQVAASSEKFTDRVLTDLDEARPRRPLFLWVHYSDPGSESRESGTLGGRGVDRYDSEVARTDRAIGRLLAGLRTRGILDDAVIALTATHGEEFGEHGGTLHDTLYEEVLRVPLLVRAPHVFPAPSAGTARLIDVAPTVLGRLGIDAPADWPGRDLLATPPSDEPQFLSRDVPSRFRQRGVRVGHDKLIVVESAPPDPLDAGWPAHPGLRVGIFRYDLGSDPDERRNLYVPGDLRSAELLERLREHFGDPTLGREAERTALTQAAGVPR
jgi:arylsulfatase A-like enzyme